MEKKKTTPFYRAAEIMADNFFDGCCPLLYNSLPEYKNLITGDEVHRDFFEELFTPTFDERKEYGLGSSELYWLRGYDQTDNEVRNNRVIALLFADLLWQDLNT